MSNAGLALTAVTCVVLGACATATPPRSYLAGPHPLLTKREPLLLVADVCIERREVGAHYSPIEESKSAGLILFNRARAYLQANGIKVRPAIAAFACGVVREQRAGPLPPAARIGAPVTTEAQPYGVAGSDPGSDLVVAVSRLATHGFKGMQAKRKERPVSVTPDEADAPGEIADAAKLISERTSAGAMLYIDVRGASRSEGVQLAEGAGRFALRLLAGDVVPLKGFDGSILRAGLFDLQSARVGWLSGLVVNPEDSTDPSGPGVPRAIHVLLREAVFYPAQATPE